jgi:FixJ family two-component response regulator
VLTGVAKPVVVGVDDDFRVRESIARLAESAGYVPQMFSSAEHTRAIILPMIGPGVVGASEI